MDDDQEYVLSAQLEFHFRVDVCETVYQAHGFKLTNFNL